jgi:hypothetical protein
MIYKHCIPCQISRNKVPQTYIEIFAKYGQLRRTISLLSLASIDIDGGLPKYCEQPLTRVAQPWPEFGAMPRLCCILLPR